jgi:hypothetical protein
MSSTPNTFPPLPPGFDPHYPSRPKTWLEKHWIWVLASLVVACVLVIGLFVFGLLALVHAMFASSYPYKEALARAKDSAEVAAEIGTPLHAGWLITGSINTAGSSGDASFDIPISGPKGKGTIFVVAKERANRWEFETLEVDIEGQSQPIELEPPANVQPAPSPDNTI